MEASPNPSKIGVSPVIKRRLEEAADGQYSFDQLAEYLLTCGLDQLESGIIKVEGIPVQTSSVEVAPLVTKQRSGDFFRERKGEPDSPWRKAVLKNPSTYNKILDSLTSKRPEIEPSPDEEL